MAFIDGAQPQPEDQGEPPRRPPAEILKGYLDYHNIAEDLDAEKLASIGERVLREYTIDEASRNEWKAQYEAAMRLARQVSEIKNSPWPGASNVKYPLITTAAIQFAARAYPAIIPGRNIVKGKVIGSDRGTPAMDPRTGGPAMQMDPRTGQPMMGPDGQPQMQWQVPPGAKQARADRVAAHMSYQLTEEMEEWEEGTDKLLHTLPIAGCMFRKIWYDQSKRRNRSQVCLPLEVVVNNGAENLERAVRVTYTFSLFPNEIEERKRKEYYLDIDLGLPSGAGDDDSAPHEFLEQCRFLDLDDDDYEEPYTVTIHKETSKVVRIEARFDQDGIEVARNGAIFSIKPIRYYIKYSFLPDPDGGFYDIGFGRLLGPINETINTSLNAMMDAGHLQNVGGGFVRQDLRIGGMSKAALKFKPGEYKGVETGSGSLRDAVLPFQHAGPSPVLFQLLGLLIDAGKEIASVKDVLTGETSGKVIQPTSLMAMIEQGLTVFTAIYKRVHRSMKQELKLLYALNSKYLPDQVYFRVLDGPEQFSGRADYAAGDNDVIPVSDPKEVSDMQRMARAEFLNSMRGDPFINQKEIRERVLRAAQMDDIPKLLVDPQPDPMMVAEMEERGFRLGMEADTAIAQNIESGARAMLAIANAEGVEAGPQIEFYKAQLGEIDKRMKEYADHARRVRAMAQQQSNQGGVQAPGGPAPPVRGPMG